MQPTGRVNYRQQLENIRLEGVGDLGNKKYSRIAERLLKTYDGKTGNGKGIYKEVLESLNPERFSNKPGFFARIKQRVQNRIHFGVFALDKEIAFAAQKVIGFVNKQTNEAQAAVHISGQKDEYSEARAMHKHEQKKLD